ncbi:MAG TPA: hypothetical protein VFA89_01585 [Terriglobales bacterium]|nr:hypothetical protein [Terriglobales bacterium]
MKSLAGSVLIGLLKQTLALLFLVLCAALAFSQEQGSAAQIKTIFPTFTTIDLPGAGVTGISAINKAGDMVGSFGQSNSGPISGFLYRSGTFTYFDYPGETVTVSNGINDVGLISGYAGQEPVYGFTYDGTNFTTVTVGSDTATFVRGINNAGALVGGAGTIYTTTGFERIGTRVKSLGIPGQWVYVEAAGINNLGQIAGFTDSLGFKCAGGKCQTLAVPGATQTSAEGINDAGVIVGWYLSGSCDCGFLLKGGKFLSFKYPGAAFTEAQGINNSGQVVGSYTFDFTTYHGFVTNPITVADLQ